MLRTLSAVHLIKSTIQRHVLGSTTTSFYTTKTPIKTDELNINPRITLIDANEELSILNLKEAHEIAKNTKLKLVKITDLDVKTRRPLYKLISPNAYLEARLKSRIEKKEAKKIWAIKGEKAIVLTTKIGEHDYQTAVKKITKWLEKAYSVRVVIEINSSSSDADGLFSRLVAECGDTCKVQQKVVKSSTVKFSLQPLPPKADKDDSEQVNEQRNL